MIIKHLPKDFQVDEVFDLEAIKNKQDSGTQYHYLLLKKTNYAQIRAIKQLAHFLNTSGRNIHFAGTKDKIAVTTQVISVMNISKERLDKHITYINTEVQDLELSYLDSGFSRINLGDNRGNKFTLTLRDLCEEEIQKASNLAPLITKEGVLNYFDDQRFGFAHNSHIVGKYILQNNIEQAVYTILVSLPDNPSEEHRLFVQNVRENWNAIKNQDQDVISSTIQLATDFLSNEVAILEHLKRAKNDFPGALRTLPKKLRTLYISAYQSYIFNQLLDLFGSRYTELPLINNSTQFEDKELEGTVKNFLSEDKLTLEHFNLPSMPELRLKESTRVTTLYPQNLKLEEPQIDECFEGKKKMILSFELEAGAYATTVVKALFQERTL